MFNFCVHKWLVKQLPLGSGWWGYRGDLCSGPGTGEQQLWGEADRDEQLGEVMLPLGRLKRFVPT